MARDYANTPKQKHPASLPGWVWMLGGLTIGLFIAFLVYIDNQTGASNKSITDSVSGFIKDFKQSQNDTRDVKKTPSAEAPPPPPEAKDKPRFDFYTILPELEVAIPEQDLIEAGKKALENKDSDNKTATVQASKSGTRYILQAGSFKNPAQADQLKARLALFGVEANVQKVTINNGDTWHRVRVGPINDISTLNQTRKRLQNNGIATMVVKEKS